MMDITARDGERGYKENSGCEYCGDSGYMKIRETDGRHVVRVIMYECGGFIAPINYCPMCGRKLKNEA